MPEADRFHLDVRELAERLPGGRAVAVERAEDDLILLAGGDVAGEQDAGLGEEERDAAVGVPRGVDDAGAQIGQVLVAVEFAVDAGGSGCRDGAVDLCVKLLLDGSESGEGSVAVALDDGRVDAVGSDARVRPPA